jgi:hypothetical protein
MRELIAECGAELMVVDLPAGEYSVPLSFRDYISRIGLASAMTVPFLYYGTQVVAAPFFPDYSVRRQAFLGPISRPVR